MLSGVFFYWLTINVVLFFAIWFNRDKAVFRGEIPKLKFVEFCLILGIIFFILILAFIAYTAPPNTYDSMTYHMSRVAHWQQNRSVYNFASHDIRQDIFPPFCEYFILHIQILSQSDRYANFVQWFSMLGCLILSSLVAQLLGLSRLGQIISGFLSVTIPVGILQATSTQNDYVLSFYFLCFVYFILLALKNFKFKFLILSGLSLGLAFLTKATAYFFCAPFLLFLCVNAYKKRKFLCLSDAAFILFFSLIVNIPYYCRTLSLSLGLYMDSQSVYSLKNEMSLTLWLSNFIRNIVSHFFIAHRKIDYFILDVVSDIHKFIQVPVSDSRITYLNTVFAPSGYLFHEDYAGNLFHSLLFIAAIFMILLNLKKWNGRCLTYCLSVILSFCLFCFIMQWSPWSTRYSLVFFILSAPIVAHFLVQHVDKRIAAVILFGLYLSSSFWVFNNMTRSLVRKQNILNTSRFEQYFSPSPGFRRSYYDVFKEIQSCECKRIGLISYYGFWEYPIWAFMRKMYFNDFVIYHIKVSNQTKNLEQNGFDPCLIITDQSFKDKEIEYNGFNYVLCKEVPCIHLYRKED
ncbi:MAG: glycosyltransferase family 39 protein [Candidatus Omnitrophica bacterium]|nr:glycosyltransferase family 39 protein [Candidatus Omnitrophota bacterium]